MNTYEPIIIVFGSSKSISSVHLRFPISFSLATDESTLENLITTDSSSLDACLRRYFVVLLDIVTDEVFDRLHNDHRVRIIYSHHDFLNTSNQQKLSVIINKQWQQITLDLTSDVANFLTVEGKKQINVGQMSLAQLYYRQARSLKEWAMSFVKAEPCHILLIPLNSSQENLEKTHEELKNICSQLGYPSTIIRKLDEYIPNDNIGKHCLMPYASTLFQNEDPNYICTLIKGLSPLRLYLYGNENSIVSEWSNLIITQETVAMEDEDSWFAFLENEPVDNDIKWNFGCMFGEKWKVSRISPISLNFLEKNLRFQSALRRAFKTFNQRQTEITTEIFRWHDQCIANGHLQLEPKLTNREEDKITNKIEGARTLYQSEFRYVSTIPQHYLPSNTKGDSFIWLSEILNYPVKSLDDIIQPSKWNVFNNISTCVPYIEIQLREEKRIFLVVSNFYGHKLFLTCSNLISLIPFVYIFCPQLDLNSEWTEDFFEIREVYRNFRFLGEQIKQDLSQVYSINIDHQYSLTDQNIITNHNINNKPLSSSWVIYDRNEPHLFLAHQREIDTLLRMPRNEQSRDEMFAGFRQICKDDSKSLHEICKFEESYDSKNAIYWYSHEMFLFRAVNKAFRDNDTKTIFKIRYFLTDLYSKINERHRMFYSLNQSQDQDLFIVYRGQCIARTDFEYFQMHPGSIICTKTFLSATRILDIAHMFASSFSRTEDVVGVIFNIKIHRFYLNIRPFASISQVSRFPDEEEVLFAMGSTFRIQSIRTFNLEDDIRVIDLELIDLDELNRVILSNNNQYIH